MGEASTWGKVWGGQALTQEVPKPVISGGWKQIPRNCCVLLTLFSYFGLCCWQLLEMKQAVTWWGKCSIPACVQKVSWQMPYEWHNLPPVSAGILPSFLGRKTQRTAWMRTEMMWSAYAKQSGKSARLFFHGENYWPCFFWHTSHHYNDDDGDSNQTERPAVILSCPLLQGIKQNAAWIQC